MRGKQGFTLVEIMIVVAIIGLLAAIAIPSFQKARHTALKNAFINDIRVSVGCFSDHTTIRQILRPGQYPLKWYLPPSLFDRTQT